jgi:hypothetical protein
MTPAALRAAVLARIADVQDLADAAGRAVALAVDLDAATMAQALGDVDRAAAVLRQLLAHLPEEGGPLVVTARESPS